jgi:hypothetical protein
MLLHFVLSRSISANHLAWYLLIDGSMPYSRYNLHKLGMLSTLVEKTRKQVVNKKHIIRHLTYALFVPVLEACLVPHSLICVSSLCNFLISLLTCLHRPG